jgi:hypothetical protein
VLVLLGSALIGVVSGRPLQDLLRDPLAVAGLPPYVGLVSNIGVLLWAAAATLSTYAAALRWLAGFRDRATAFLALFALLSAALTVDDLFMLHEWVFPMVLRLPQWLPLVGEVLLLGVLLIGFRAVYLGHNLFFLASALFGLGASATIDLVPEGILPAHHLLEDGLKLIGIANWLGFSAQTASRYLRAGSAGET